MVEQYTIAELIGFADDISNTLYTWSDLIGFGLAKAVGVITDFKMSDTIEVSYHEQTNTMINMRPV